MPKIEINTIFNLLICFYVSLCLTPCYTGCHSILVPMDYIGSKKQINKLLKITSNFSTDFHMDFSLEKCNFLNIERGKIIIKRNKIWLFPFIIISNRILLSSCNRCQTAYLTANKTTKISIINTTTITDRANALRSNRQYHT